MISFLKKRSLCLSLQECFCTIGCCLLCTFTGFSQELLEEMQPPLDIPMALSGNFGEFRKTHFHAGVDIKTEGRQGLKVRSVLNGWVHRLRVSTSGYGKCLYVKHPNGLISVYAHLKKFSPRIKSFVKKAQYEKESFEIQLFPALEELPIKKGEVIGYSGNTGGSFGPHLHFELRDAKNQHPLNPLKFLKGIEDTERPYVQALYLYQKDEGGQQSRTEMRMERINDSVFRAGFLEASGTISFGMRMFDRQNRSYNRNGVHRVELAMNGTPQIEYYFDEMDFQDSKYINLFVDYEVQRERGIKIQQLVQHPAAEVSFLGENSGNGYLFLEAGKSYQIMVTLSDFHGNNTYVELYCKGVVKEEIVSESILEKEGTVKIEPHLDYLFEYAPWSLYFSQKTFFENVVLDVESRNDTLIIDRDRYPIAKPFELRFKLQERDSIALRQQSIARLEKDEPLFVPAHRKELVLEAKAAVLGTYFLTRDSIAPEIKHVNFKEGQWLSNFQYLRVALEDDFSGIQSYRATINGQWALFEYEPKDNSLIYSFNDHTFKSGKQNLEIVAKDNVGNETRFSTFFYRVYRDRK